MITLSDIAFIELTNTLMKHKAIDDSEDSARREYSGRVMYGRESCLAFVVDSPVRFALMLHRAIKEVNESPWVIHDEDWEDIDIDDFLNVYTDDMGLSTVIYWPNIQVAK